MLGVAVAIAVAASSMSSAGGVPVQPGGIPSATLQRTLQHADGDTTWAISRRQQVLPLQLNNKWSSTIATTRLGEAQLWKSSFKTNRKDANANPLVQPNNVPGSGSKGFAEECLLVGGQPATVNNASSGIMLQFKFIKVSAEDCKKNVFTTTTDAYTVGDNTVGITWDTPLDASPGRVGIDSESGEVYASPAVAGCYTIWLVATNVKGKEVDPGLDQVLVKRWNFVVTESAQMQPESIVAFVSVAFVAILIVLAVLVLRARNTYLNTTTRHDPLSMVEKIIQANRNSLAESVKLTAKYKQEYDATYSKTCAAYFETHPAMEERFEASYERCTVQASDAMPTPGGAGALVQPDLGFKDVKSNTIPLKRQRRYLKALMNMMHKVGPIASAKLRSIVKQVNQEQELAPDAAVTLYKAIRFEEGPMKKWDRILEKADSHGAQYQFVRDYARGTCVVSHIIHVAVLLEQLVDCDEFEVVRVKNRLLPEYNTLQSGGFRDVQLVLRVTEPDASDGKGTVSWLYELQIMTVELFNLKLGERIDVAATGSAKTSPGAGRKIQGAYKHFRKCKELQVRMKDQLDQISYDLLLIGEVGKTKVEEVERHELDTQQTTANVKNSRNIKGAARIVPLKQAGEPSSSTGVGVEVVEDLSEGDAPQKQHAEQDARLVPYEDLDLEVQIEGLLNDLDEDADADEPRKESWLDGPLVLSLTREEVVTDTEGDQSAPLTGALLPLK